MVDPSRRRIDTSNGIGLTEKWRSASRGATEAEGEKWGKRERGISKWNESTLHVVLHLPSNATATTVTTAAAPEAAAAALRMQ